MSSQTDTIELTSSQAEIYRQLTREVSADTDITQFCEQLLECSAYKLDITHIQGIDCCLLQYSVYILDKARVITESDNVIEAGGDLMQALTAYYNSLTRINSSCSPLLSDVIGYLVLSGKLVQTLLTKVVELVTADKPCQSVEQLKKLWDTLHEFIMKLISLLDKYQSCDSHSGISSSIQELVLSLACIGKELAAVDTKAMVLVYKCTLRLLTKETRHRSNAVLAAVVECVCHTTSSKLAQSSTQQNQSKVLVYLLRILSKLMTFVSVNVQICWTPVTDIVLVVSTSLTGCMYGGTQTDANLEMALKSLLNSCLHHEHFRLSLLGMAHKASNLERVLYIVSVIHECLASSPQTYTHWWTEEHMLNLSTLLSLCGNELCLLNAKVHKKSAYEFVLARLAAMMVTVSAGPTFQQVEKSLLVLLMSPAVHVNLLAADCWHFLARYSSDRLPYIHCCKLLDLLKDLRLTDRQVSAVQHVVHRLVGIMSPAVQTDLAKCATAFDSGVLANVSFNEQAQTHVESGGMASLEKHMKILCNGRTAQCDLLYSLKAMARLLHIPYRQVEGEKLSLQAADMLTDILIANLQNTALDYCMCLAIGSCSSRRRLHPQLLKLLHQLHPVVSSRSTNLQTKLVDCLSQVSTLPTAQDKQLVVLLYKQAISSNDLSIRLHSLESFKLFAKSTPYQELISEIAAHSSDVNERIVQYCSVQTEHSSLSISGLQVNLWDLSQFDWTRADNKCSTQPAAKRQRIDPEETICRLKELVERIQESSSQFNMAQRKQLQQLSSDLNYIASHTS